MQKCAGRIHRIAGTKFQIPPFFGEILTAVVRRRWQVIPVPTCGLHPWGANRCPLWQKANGSCTGPVTVRHGESSAGPHPPSNGYGHYGILVVCRINLWPAVRMELGQEGWLKQLVAKVRWPIMAGDQGSRRGHHCSEAALTGNPYSHVKCQLPTKENPTYV
jgi:hypothetical protein